MNNLKLLTICILLLKVENLSGSTEIPDNVTNLNAQDLFSNVTSEATTTIIDEDNISTTIISDTDIEITDSTNEYLTTENTTFEEVTEIPEDINSPETSKENDWEPWNDAADLCTCDIKVSFFFLHKTHL